MKRYYIIHILYNPDQAITEDKTPVTRGLDYACGLAKTYADNKRADGYRITNENGKVFAQSYRPFV